MRYGCAYARLWVDRTECTGLRLRAPGRAGTGQQQRLPGAEGWPAAPRAIRQPHPQPWNWYSSSGPIVAAATLFQATLSIWKMPPKHALVQLCRAEMLLSVLLFLVNDEYKVRKNVQRLFI